MSTIPQPRFPSTLQERTDQELVEAQQFFSSIASPGAWPFVQSREEIMEKFEQERARRRAAN